MFSSLWHELRILKNSKAFFTQRPGKTWTLAHIVPSPSPQQHCLCPARHVWTAQARWTAGTMKQEKRNFFPETPMTKQPPDRNKAPACAFKPGSQRKSIHHICMHIHINPSLQYIFQIHTFCSEVAGTQIFTVFLSILAEGFWPFPLSNHFLAWQTP